MQAIASILQSGARSAFFPRTPTTAEGGEEEEEEEEECEGDCEKKKKKKGCQGDCDKKNKKKQEGLKSFGGEDGEEGGYGEAD